MEYSEDASGVAYDFGVNIARGAVSSIAGIAATVVTLTGSIYALLDAGKGQEKRVRENQLALGGYSRLVKTMDFFSKKIKSGESYFDTTDLIAGSRDLIKAGVDIKDNFDIINKSAQGIGQNFSDVSSIIRSGNYSALAEAGLITDRMATNMSRMTFTQEQGTRRVLKILRDAEKKGMFEGNFRTLSQIGMRIKKTFMQLVKGVIGDLKDPSGFWFQLRKSFSEFSDWFATKGAVIKKVGQAIGQVLIFIIKVVSDFVKWMYRGLSRIIGKQDSFFANWEEKMKSFGLFMEIIRVKIKAFTEEWGGLILKLWAVNSALNAFAMVGGLKATGRLITIFKVLRGGKGLLLAKLMFKNSWLGKLMNWVPRLVPLMNGLAASIAGASAAALWPIAIIAAVIVLVVLLIKYWDDIRKKVNNVSDGVLAMITIFFPMIGLIMTVAKYWTEVKNIATNVWQVLVNLTDIIISIGSLIWDYIVVKFKEGWAVVEALVMGFDNLMTNTFGDAWATVKAIFITPLMDAFDSIKKWWDEIDFGAAFDWVSGLFSGLADDTKVLADGLAAGAGRESFAKQGENMDQTINKEIQGHINKGKNDDEILDIMGSRRTSLNKIASLRNKSNPSSSQIGSLPLSSKESGGNNSSSSEQNNNFYIQVSEKVDVTKVTDAVNKANKRKETIDKRRTGE